MSTFENDRIVAIGGGSGLSIILKGLKKTTKHITAIVSVGDDGGGLAALFAKTWESCLPAIFAVVWLPLPMTNPKWPAFWPIALNPVC